MAGRCFFLKHLRGSISLPGIGDMKEERPVADRQRSDPETWVDRHGDYLYRYALSRIQNPAFAEDLVQETFLAALRSHESFEHRSSERTWLTSILKHKIIDHLRRTQREQPFHDADTFPESIDDLFDKKGQWKEKPVKWTVNPLKLLEQKEFWEVLNRCLSELPERLTQAFKLREMEGLGCEEICNVLNISSSNCWVMLYRARMALRRCLEVNWFGAKSIGGS